MEPKTKKSSKKTPAKNAKAKTPKSKSSKTPRTPKRSLNMTPSVPLRQRPCSTPQNMLEEARARYVLIRLKGQGFIHTIIHSAAMKKALLFQKM